MIETMNDELSPAELTRLYDRLKKRGESALKPYSETHLCQLLDFIEDKIQAMLVTQGRFKIANPTYPHDFEPEGLQSNKRALEIVNDLLQNGRPPEPENTSDEQTTAKTGFDFTEPEAALYLAYTGQQATTYEEAKKHLYLFKKLNTPEKLRTSFNRVRSARERQKLANSLNEEGRTKIENHRERIEKVMQHLNDAQKLEAQNDLDYITGITS
jgi:cysteinyl-tRNA synthetase